MKRTGSGAFTGCPSFVTVIIGCRKTGLYLLLRMNGVKLSAAAVDFAVVMMRQSFFLRMKKKEMYVSSVELTTV